MSSFNLQNTRLMLGQSWHVRSSPYMFKKAQLKPHSQYSMIMILARLGQTTTCDHSDEVGQYWHTDRVYHHFVLPYFSARSFFIQSTLFLQFSKAPLIALINFFSASGSFSNCFSGVLSNLLRYFTVLLSGSSAIVSTICCYFLWPWPPQRALPSSRKGRKCYQAKQEFVFVFFTFLAQ